MKKLIVFAVVLALIAGTAFADTSVGGALELHYTAASGNTEGNGTSTTSLSLAEAYLQIAYTNDDGTISGILRPKFHAASNEINRGFIWWKPIEQLSLFFGKDGDGLFNTRLRKNSVFLFFCRKIIRKMMKRIENDVVYRRKIDSKKSFCAV